MAISKPWLPSSILVIPHCVNAWINYLNYCVTWSRQTNVRSKNVVRWVAVLGIVIVLASVALVWMMGGTPESTSTTVQNVEQTINQITGVGAMNRNLGILIGGALFLVIPLLLLVFLYNSLVSK